MKQDYYVFTRHGAVLVSDTSAVRALRRFMKSNPAIEPLGIFLDALIVKPPIEPGQAKPFLMMFIQGKLEPQPSPES